MSPSQPLRILFAAGQTAGHVNPALAIAAELTARHEQTRVFFASTRDGFERQLIARAGHTPQFVRAAPLRGGSLLTGARGVAVLPAAFADATALVRRVSPDLTIGIGGYLSGAVLLAAALRRRPTLILEPNVRPGLANRCLAPFVDTVAVASSDTVARIGGTAVLTGNPVRAGLFDLATRAGDGRLNLLIVGGTQGSHAVNRVMGEALRSLNALGRPIAVAHQAGQADIGAMREVYRHAEVPARVEAFFDDIGREYERADLVVAAAGATTCAELAAVGRASILIPLANAGHHQRENARAMERAGAAVMLDERRLTPAALVEQVVTLLQDDWRRRAMATAATQLARPGAAASVVDLVYDIVTRYRERRPARHRIQTCDSHTVAVEERDAP